MIEYERKDRSREWSRRYYAAHPEKRKEFSMKHWEREKRLMETDPEYRAKRIACKHASSRRYYQKNKERLNKQRVEFSRNNERDREQKLQYREAHKEHIQKVQKAYREAHKDYYNQKQREFYYRRKARTAQMRALQATIGELLDRLTTLEHTRVQNERQRLQWGWDMQQVRIKLRKTRVEIERMSTKTRR